MTIIKNREARRPPVGRVSRRRAGRRWATREARRAAGGPCEQGGEPAAHLEPDAASRTQSNEIRYVQRQTRGWKNILGKEK
jgi:hypothetical protein